MKNEVIKNAVNSVEDLMKYDLSYEDFKKLVKSNGLTMRFKEGEFDLGKFYLRVLKDNEEVISIPELLSMLNSILLLQEEENIQVKVTDLVSFLRKAKGYIAKEEEEEFIGITVKAISKLVKSLHSEDSIYEFNNLFQEQAIILSSVIYTISEAYYEDMIDTRGTVKLELNDDVDKVYEVLLIHLDDIVYGVDLGDLSEDGELLDYDHEFEISTFDNFRNRFIQKCILAILVIESLMLPTLAIGFLGLFVKSVTFSYETTSSIHIQVMIMAIFYYAMINWYQGRLFRSKQLQHISMLVMSFVSYFLIFGGILIILMK